MLGCTNFWSTSREKDKFPPIQQEAGQIWTAAASELHKDLFNHKYMVWWQYVEVWAVAEAPNSTACKLACPPRGHRVTLALPCVLGGIGMSSGLRTPQVGARKKITT